MSFSFEDEVRTYLRHRAEQNSTLHRLQTHEISIEILGVQEALEMLAGLCADQTALILRAAQEIDKLRAAADDG